MPTSRTAERYPSEWYLKGWEVRILLRVLFCYRNPVDDGDKNAEPEKVGQKAVGIVLGSRLVTLSVWPANWTRREELWTRLGEGEITKLDEIEKHDGDVGGHSKMEKTKQVIMEKVKSNLQGHTGVARLHVPLQKSSTCQCEKSLLKNMVLIEI